MNGPHLRFTLQVDRWPSNRDISYVIPIDDVAAREAFRVLDEPSKYADPLTAVIFCTPPDTIRNVKRTRDALAKSIAEHILRGIEQHDLTMGYKREPRNANADR